MKAKKFTEEQIIMVLKQHERGVSAKDICRQHGLAPATLYRWKTKFGGMEVSDAKKLRALEDENRRLKKLVADLEFPRIKRTVVYLTQFPRDIQAEI